MKNLEKTWDVIIIGGSFSGLAAALALGRSIRNVLVIDDGKPCNRQTPHAHNLLTHDGKPPFEIKLLAKSELSHYPTVQFLDSKAIKVSRSNSNFELKTENGENHFARKLLFATGVTDVMPDIPGFKESWGISVFHCPYCHGYEVRDQKLGVFANGDIGYESIKLISQWSKNLTFFTNGQSSLSKEQNWKLNEKKIKIIETEISSIENNNGYLTKILLKDGKIEPLDALMARVPFVQHSHLPLDLGVELDEIGYIKVDGFNKTNLKGVYAAGDNTTMLRSLAAAIASGTLSGAMINKELIGDDF
ncbi:NAD(P)/FAD-dependent oxidoreductase [Leptospira ilyithenensis]|uniref:NAD(P)/FAD-dependent oxidoreductase n=1 Tax=Leptospira ilyithenensis TaxID=2484901 RepID=A0A4R9LPV6_9LEPT|nr:NAD(P)/FAD-dependent oxidoreductase [Leptospira ilyithenensis]TGN09713.1 NAD(P)/FAD-dependent oxidoreductase [Leptospira ilyithenensis]